MPCLIKVSEFITRVYGTEDSTPPTPQTITRKCRNGELPAELHGEGKRKTWYIDWKRYQQRTGNDLVDKVIRGI